MFKELKKKQPCLKTKEKYENDVSPNRISIKRHKLLKEEPNRNFGVENTIKVK